MPKLQVLACPSCGASLSIEQGAATAQCAFCGTTSVVPAELRGPVAGSAASSPTPTPFGGLTAGPAGSRRSQQAGASAQTGPTSLNSARGRVTP